MIHALRWWRRLRRLAESRLDPAIARRSAAAAARPARCAGDLAAVAERLLAEWHAAGTAAVEADLRILSVALLAFSDQLAARTVNRAAAPRGPVRQPRRPPTRWPHATSLTCHQVGTRPGG